MQKSYRAKLEQGESKWPTKNSVLKENANWNTEAATSGDFLGEKKNSSRTISFNGNHHSQPYLCVIYASHRLPILKRPVNIFWASDVMGNV